MKKYICKMISYILVWGIIMAGLNWLLSSNYEFSYMMMKEMYECPENIDVLFSGSSHAFRTYDTALADELLGEKTFNAGSNGQLLATSYYLLREVAARNQLKTVYLDTCFMIGQRTIPENEGSMYYISDYMKWSSNKIEYLWDAGGLRSFANGIFCTSRRNLRNINIIENIQSKSLAAGDYSNLTFEHEIYRGDGFVYVDAKLGDVDNVDFEEMAGRYDLTAAVPMVDDAYEYLIKIIDYCAENNIELVLVDQPMPDELITQVKGYDNYVSFLTKLSEEYNISYLNFNLYKGYEKSLDDYYDENHLNGSGAEKYTEIFCNTVKSLRNSDKTVDELFYKEYSSVRKE